MAVPAFADSALAKPSILGWASWVEPGDPGEHTTRTIASGAATAIAPSSNASTSATYMKVRTNPTFRHIATVSSHANHARIARDGRPDRDPERGMAPIAARSTSADVKCHPPRARAHRALPRSRDRRVRVPRAGRRAARDDDPDRNGHRSPDRPERSRRPRHARVPRDLPRATARLAGVRVAG